MSQSRLNLPNLITVARIVVCPAIFLLAISPSITNRFAAFVLFVLAGLSDLWDGYLARKHGWITDMGKLLDPLADKLLLASTFIPFYIVSHRPDEVGRIPWWGALPLWVVVVIFGRELFITLFRSWATKRGVVIAAGQSGKYKAFAQSLFMGGLLLWYPLAMTARRDGWDGDAWGLWAGFHGAFVALTLLVALLLTIYSLIDYLWRYRSLFGMRS